MTDKPSSPSVEQVVAGLRDITASDSWEQLESRAGAAIALIQSLSQSAWVPVSERLPEDGIPVNAFIDIEAMAPGRARHIELVQGVVNNMPDEDRSIPIEPGRRIELYKQQPPRTRYVVLDGRSRVEADENGIPFLTLQNHFGHFVANSDCVTHWMVPLPPLPASKGGNLNESTGEGNGQAQTR